MLSNVGCSELQERLLNAVHDGSYEETLACLRQGANATFISYNCGRTAVGSAALMGDPEILQLLLQACEEPDSEIFRPGKRGADLSSSTSAGADAAELDTTPDGMDNLEWEDEFKPSNTDAMNNSTNANKDDTIEASLYYYYAKTFERTGGIVSNTENFCSGSCFKPRVPMDPHILDHMTMAPLHYAAVGGSGECARLLLEHGAKVDVTTAEGYTPLHIGANNNSDVARMLLSYGANPNSKTFNTQETSLHSAIKYRNTLVVNLLLQTPGVNINEVDENDKTPLIFAIIHDQPEVAIELVSLGARVNLQDKEGYTALYYAVDKNMVLAAAALLENGARQITSHYLLHKCITSNMPDMADTLLVHDERLHNMKVRNPEGFTPIQLAIIYKKFDMLDYMLSLDASSLMLGIENDLILSVHYADNLSEFRVVARVLCAHSVGSMAHAMSARDCYVPFCHTPLSRAIMLNKLNMAEFLIKDGFDIGQLCPEHVVNNLRSLRAPGCKQFTKFLIMNGFRFPFYPCITMPEKWSSERREYEQDMQQLCTQPLDLKCLARIQIRKHLLKNFYATTEYQRDRYRATEDKSSLQQMTEQLEIPKILQTYLIDFYDCESVMALYD